MTFAATGEIAPATAHLTVPGVGLADIDYTERGQGRPVLLLHGGGGPQTVTPWADRFAEARPARVVVPVHPGFGGTPRPDALDSIRALAAAYVAFLDTLDLSDVVVVGNSIGGWIAAEMALLDSPRVAGYVLVDAVGITVEDHPVVDFLGLSFAEIGQHSYHDPAKFALDPAKLPAAAHAVMAGNRAALELYAGRSSTDPTLAGRLGGITSPTLVVWGEADRIADPDYGRAYAAAIPGARYELMLRTGHLPQIETPDELIDVVRGFADGH